MLSLAKRAIAPLVPKRLKQTIKQSICDRPENYFRICSPATAPELAQCTFELQRDKLLEGRSYYEFGLFRGYALWFVQDMIRRFGISEFHCYGFDSFAGLPESTSIGDEGSTWSAGDYSVSREQVEKNLRDYNADLSRISLFEGFFSDELFGSFTKKVNFRTAALVLIDCDLYASTVPVLRFVADHLADGAIVLFDDYNCFKAADDRGQRRALREFLTEHPTLRFNPLRGFGWHGQGFRIDRIT
jgi:O-methyltransferase